MSICVLSTSHLWIHVVHHNGLNIFGSHSASSLLLSVSLPADAVATSAGIMLHVMQCICILFHGCRVKTQKKSPEPGVFIKTGRETLHT